MENAKINAPEISTVSTGQKNKMSIIGFILMLAGPAILILASLLAESFGYLPRTENTNGFLDTIALRDENEILKRILADNGISNEGRHPIDVEYEKAMSNPEVWTTVGMSYTTTIHGDMWKAEMEKYLELLTEELADDKKKWVVESQEKWEVFTKDNEELTWQIYDQMHHGGSIMSNLTASIYYEKYRTRALYLKSLYDYLNFEG